MRKFLAVILALVTPLLAYAQQEGGAGTTQRLAETAFYRTGVYENETEGASRKQYMVNEYGFPEIIIYREAFDLSLLTEISRAEYDSKRNGDCDGDCLFIKVIPYPNGSIKSITTTYDHRASTGVISNTFSFETDGLLSSMSIDADFAGYAPVEIHHYDTKGGRQVVLIEKFEYFQGGVGEAVTVTRTIDFNDRYEVTDHHQDYKTETIYSGPDESGYGP